MIRSAGEMTRKLDEVRSRVDAAAARAGRVGADVRIIGVTKRVPVDVVRWAVDCGLTDLGENDVRELEARAADIAAEWHFIGRLQSNTARRVGRTAAFVHSVVPGRGAARLDRAATERGIDLPVLLQVDFGTGRAGVQPEEVADAAGELRSRGRLALRGLMTIAPATAAGEAARGCFRELRRLRDQAWKGRPEQGELSMGMSGDYEVAVEEGATMVRIGSALFGTRSATGKT